MSPACLSSCHDALSDENEAVKCKSYNCENIEFNEVRTLKPLCPFVISEYCPNDKNEQIIKIKVNNLFMLSFLQIYEILLLF